MSISLQTISLEASASTRRSWTKPPGIMLVLAVALAAGCSQSPSAPSSLPGTATSVAPDAAGVPESLAASAPAATAQSVVPRGSLIVRQGETYVNTSVSERCNCKEFARRVVREASGGKVNLPSTASNNWEWNLPSFGVQMFATIKPSSPRPIYGVDAGDIIQMVSRKSGLHTAIVKSNFGSGMQFVEANYTSCKVTNSRSQSFSAFLSEMSGWTVYRISW